MRNEIALAPTHVTHDVDTADDRRPTLSEQLNDRFHERFAGEMSDVLWRVRGRGVFFSLSVLAFRSNGTQTHAFSNTWWENQAMHVIFNMAVGGDIGQDSSGFESPGEWARLEVDWVAWEAHNN